MKKLVLAGISIFAVSLLVLVSQTSVIGYQAIQESQQKKINQKDLFFQTVSDLVNNKDIQRAILSSQTNVGGFFNPIVKLPIITPLTLTKNQLNRMYVVGVVLSKFISKAKIHSMVSQYQVIYQGMHGEISTIIEKSTKLKGEINQLSGQSCNCGIESNFTWNFPVLCILVFALFIIAAIFGSGYEFVAIIFLVIAGILSCRWTY
jgi:uncharacterized membrane protein